MFLCSISGLERVAEELMGRRKWKLYQEVLARSHLNSNSTTNLSQVNNTETGNYTHYFIKNKLYPQTQFTK